jgi:hypothetical protein
VLVRRPFGSTQASSEPGLDAAAIAWVGGGENIRAQVGMGLACGQDLIDIPKIMPCPDVALWWTF